MIDLFLQLTITLIIAYVIGSIPTGYLIVKSKTGDGIRKIGSGSTGATNVKRVLGKKWFFIVLLLDAFKGALPVVLATIFATRGTHLGLAPVIASELENSTIQIPEIGTNFSRDWKQQTVNILEQSLTAIENEGWSFTGWEPGSTRRPTEEEEQLYISLIQPLTANFERNLCNLQFIDTTGDYIKSPDSSPTNFTVFYNTVVEPTFIDNVLKNRFINNVLM